MANSEEVMPDETPESTAPRRDANGRLIREGEPEETPLEALASICNVIVIALFAFAFVGQNFEIPSGSMKNTLLIGDHLVVDRSTLAPATKWAPFVHYRKPERGDIIVFFKPNPEQPDLILVKRVIGIPGDRIHLVNNTVYLNGVAQPEPYKLDNDTTQDPSEGTAEAFDAYRDNFPSVSPEGNQLVTAVWAQELPTRIQNGDLVVPEGKVFAMGDNRHNSLDGRYWGFVPDENIMGRPMFVYWSFKTPADQENKTGMADRIGFVFHVLIHIFDGTRWSRTLHVIR